MSILKKNVIVSITYVIPAKAGIQYKNDLGIFFRILFFILFAISLSNNLWAASLSPQEEKGLAFLKANMPDSDKVILSERYLEQDVHLAYKVMKEVPWGKDIPDEIFLNNVLPYASVNERRDNWRADFHRRFIAIAKKSKTLNQAVITLNRYVFWTFHVTYNLTKRPKPDQSPYETIKAHYASCTGLSILLVDALRSVGVPARIAAIPLWADESGNHTWVEIWDKGWHYVGAGESTQLDQAWFTDRAAHTDAKHPIYATSFKKTNLIFPMVWAPDLNYIPAVDVTNRYTESKQ